jgi:hypothetical protein
MIDKIYFNSPLLKFRENSFSGAAGVSWVGTDSNFNRRLAWTWTRLVSSAPRGLEPFFENEVRVELNAAELMRITYLIITI